MAAPRPWYIKALDASHRIVVLSLIGFSGYLAYGTYQSLKYNYHRKMLRQQEKAAAADGAGENPDASAPDATVADK